MNAGVSYERGEHPNSRRAIERSRRPGKFPLQRGKGRYAVGLARIAAMLRHLAATAEGLTCDELRAEYDVSRHLVYRDLVVIKNAGFPIVAEWDADHRRRYRLSRAPAGLVEQPHCETIGFVQRAIRVLRSIEQAGSIGRTLEQLANAEGCDKAAVQRTLDVLEDAGVPLFVNDDDDDEDAPRRWRVLHSRGGAR